MISGAPQVNEIHTLFESLDQFDTSKTKRLKIDHGNSLSSDPPYRALLPMKDLHTLVLSHCPTSRIFIDALDPSTNQSGVLVCPKLEEIVIKHMERLDIKDILGTMEVRASRGAKLKLFRITAPGTTLKTDVSGLEKHVFRVECNHEVYGANDGDGENKDG